ncbi:MAG TPA: L,D-transpeptidase [Geomonas sp.]|nr:L,D-transpeptidase [Geomonas sp.]
MKALALKGLIPLLLLTMTCTVSAAPTKLNSLCQLHYPSDYLYEWNCVQLTNRDSPYRIFGKYWKDGLRFNRMDRRHFIAGLSIKVPKRVKEIKDFTPMPQWYQEAEQEPQFIVIDQNEMFLGAYEYGKLVFSTPVAVGIDGMRLKNGFYQIDAVDRRHESSLYKVEGSDRYYPMHYALRLFIEKREEGWTTYWLHGRDIPGYPASHGCIGLYDEEMQKEYYHDPSRPILMDAKRLFLWVLGDAREHGKLYHLGKGPKVLIIGEPPAAAPEPQPSPVVPLVPASAKPGQRP